MLENLCFCGMALLNMFLWLLFNRLREHNEELLEDNIKFASAFIEYRKCSGVDIFEYLNAREIVLDDEENVTTL